MKFSDISICVISHKRPDNISHMEEVTGQELTWVVGKDEANDYSHAKGTVLEGGKLCESRNLCLEMAFEQKKHCLMLDDDYVKTHLFTNIGQEIVDFSKLLKEMRAVLLSTPLYLAGTASTFNRFFYHPSKPLGLKHFIGGWCTLTKLGSIPRYDEKLLTKEDYDITLQHVKEYGGVCRINYLAPEFKHWNNAGGVVDYRTDEVEQKSVNYLKEKWGNVIRDNIKRPNEILLRL